MDIKGVEGMSRQDIEREMERGGRFIMFQYCISIVLVTFRRPSHIFFVPGGSSRVMKGLPYTLITLFLGWWGAPWGPIYSFQVLVSNLKGGKDITDEVWASLNKLEEEPTQEQTPPQSTEEPLNPPVNN